MLVDGVVAMRGSASSSLTDRFSQLQKQREQKPAPAQQQQRIVTVTGTAPAQNLNRANNNNNNANKNNGPRAAKGAARALLQAAQTAARSNQVAGRRGIKIGQVVGASQGQNMAARVAKKRKLNNGPRRVSGLAGLAPAQKQLTGVRGVQIKREKGVQQIKQKGRSNRTLLGPQPGSQQSRRPQGNGSAQKPKKLSLLDRVGPKPGQKQLPPSVQKLGKKLSPSLLQRIRLAQLSVSLGGKKKTVSTPVAAGAKKVVPVQSKGAGIQSKSAGKVAGKRAGVKNQTKGLSTKAKVAKVAAPKAQTNSVAGAAPEQKRRRRNRLNKPTGNAVNPTDATKTAGGSAKKVPKPETDPLKLRQQLDMDLDTYMADVVV